MFEQIHSRTWQERIGGEQALSIRAFLITSILAFAYTSQIQSFGTQSTIAIYKWIVVFIAAIAFIGFLNLILAFSVFADRATRPVPVVQALLSHGLLGLIFSIFMVVGADFMGLHQNLNIPFQITLSFILSLWWGSSFAIFLDHRAENQFARRHLIEKAIITENLKSNQHESSTALSGIFQNRLSAGLASSHAELEVRAIQDDWQNSSALLKKIAQEQVRPMSHALIEAQPLTYPRIRWWRLPFNIVNNQPINTWLIILIALVGGGPQQVELLGLRHALSMMLGLYLMILIVGSTANLLMNRFSNHHAAIFIFASLLMQLSIPINKHFRDIWVPGNSTLQWQLQQLISGLILILAASGFGAWSSINERLNANFSNDINEQRIKAIASSRLIAEQSRSAAKLLHGAVQTKLVACAIAIDHAISAGDEAKINEAIAQALIVLKSPLTEQGFGQTLAEEINRKVNLWNEICAITLAIDPAANSTDQEDIVLVGRIVEEAISNSIRHGRAKTILISVSKNFQEGVELQVTDDGRGPQGGKPSLGSALLDQASGGKWTLRSTGNGSELRIKILGR